MKIGIVGMGMSGKSTLFTALTGVPREAGAFSVKPVPGVVKVPDERLDWLRELYKPKKFTPSAIDFLDYPGLEGSKKNEIVAGVRDADALLLVLRDFESASVPPPEKGVNPLRELEDLKTEFLINDLDQVERRIEKLQASAKKPSKDKEKEERELALLLRLKTRLEGDGAVGAMELTPDEQRMINGFRLLTQKPALIAVNVSLSAIEGGKIKTYGGGLQKAIVLCAEMEKEIAELPEADRKPFLADMGLQEAVAGRLVKNAYETLGLISFFTTGEDEVRSWTIHRGDTAIIAAGKIHSDIARGFIRAEVTPFAAIREAGSERDAKARGFPMLESKEYVVKDGDIVHFRFSV